MTDDTKSNKDMHKSGWMVPLMPRMSLLLPTARISYSNDWV